jgi:hypothetical protein
MEMDMEMDQKNTIIHSAGIECIVNVSYDGNTNTGPHL